MIPLDDIFASAAAVSELTKWTKDGVHPTIAGHALIAKAWLGVVNAV